jgi:hypothetical protein
MTRIPHFVRNDDMLGMATTSLVLTAAALAMLPAPASAQSAEWEVDVPADDALIVPRAASGDA